MTSMYYIPPKVDDYTKQQYLDKVTSDLKAAISRFELDNASVTSEKLAEGAVTSAIIREASIGSAHIMDAAISNAHIGRAVIETAHIGNAVIEGGHIKNTTLEGIHIKSGTIDNINIKDATITGAKIALATIDTANIVNASITTALIRDASITTAKIGTAQITNALISDAAITTAKIQDAQIIGAKIASASIDQAHIIDGSITNAKIASLSVDNAKIKDASISSAKIQNLAVTTALIANLAVDSGKIKDLAVTTAKIGDAQITTAKIGDAQISAAKIGSAQIGTAHIVDASITSAKIGNSAITTAHLGTAIIGTANIQDASISSAKILDLIADKITSGTLSTSKITISGVGGYLRIMGNRVQVFDNATVQQERVSLGDVEGDGSVYGLRVRGADGTTILYDENGVYSEGITDGSITNTKITDNSIDNRVLAVDSVIAENIVTRSLTADKLAVGTITAQSGVIANAAIGTAQIIDANITNAKIGNAQITGAKIANATISGGNIALATITGSNIVGGTITNALIADATIQGAKIMNATLTGAKIIDGEITSAKIGNAQITTAHISTLDASVIKSGYIDTARIKIGTGTTFDAGFDPTTKETPTGAQTKADAAQNNAVSTSSGIGSFVHNPIFSKWTSAWPDGIAVWNSSPAPTKVTSTLNGGYSIQFKNTGTSQIGGTIGGFYNANIGNEKYIVVEMDVKLDRGTSFSGSGLLLDWTGMSPYRTVLKLGDEIPSPTVGKWYSVRKILKRPTDTLTGYQNMGGYLMANYTENGALTDKDISFDRLTIRKATNEEIDVYEGKSIWDYSNSLTDGWRYPNTTYINGGDLYTGTVTTNQIASKTITANNIATGTITAAEIKAGTITATNGIIASIDANKISTGTLNADLVTISNGKVVINSAGVSVKDGGFFIEDTVSATKQNIVPQTNLIVDHSFEMLEAGALSTGYYFDVLNRDEYDGWYRWKTIGWPKVSRVLDGKSPAPYGLQAALVSNAHALSQNFSIKLGKKYTVSFANQYPIGVAISTPRVVVQWWYQGSMGEDVMHSEVYADFSTPANNGSFVRNKFTATAPTTMPSTTFWGTVVLMTTGSNWAEYDGVQVIEADYPAVYQPEDEVWRMRRGTDKYTSLVANKTIQTTQINGGGSEIYFEDVPVFNKGGNALKLGAGAANHTYMSFYANSSDANMRFGYLGVPSSGSVEMVLASEQGNMRFVSTTGRYYLGNIGQQIEAPSNGLLYLKKDDSNYMRVGASVVDFYFGGANTLTAKAGEIANYAGNMVVKGSNYVVIQAYGSGQDIYLQSNGVSKSVRPNTTATYAPMWASAFTVNSQRQVKTNIVEPSKGALAKVKATKIYDYHLIDELEENEFNDKGEKISTTQRDPNSVKKRRGMILEEAPVEVVDGDGIDLYAMNATLWQAVQELSAEVELLKEGMRGVTVPANK